MTTMRGLLRRRGPDRRGIHGAARALAGVRDLARGASLAFALALGACAAPPEASAPRIKPAAPEPARTDAGHDGAIYHAASNRFFFEDIRARRVGDVINVILDERTDATKSASTNAARDTAIELPLPRILGRPFRVGGYDVSADIEGSHSFAGAADSSQSNRLSGSVAVTVQEVLANGTLRIAGEKVLRLNQGSETVRVSGLVRAADIAPDNSVHSTRLADADISYRGEGVVDDGNRPGWLTRVVIGIWPF